MSNENLSLLLNLSSTRSTVSSLGEYSRSISTSNLGVSSSSSQISSISTTRSSRSKPLSSSGDSQISVTTNFSADVLSATELSMNSQLSGFSKTQTATSENSASKSNTFSSNREGGNSTSSDFMSTAESSSSSTFTQLLSTSEPTSISGALKHFLYSSMPYTTIVTTQYFTITTSTCPPGELITRTFTSTTKVIVTKTIPCGKCSALTIKLLIALRTLYPIVSSLLLSSLASSQDTESKSASSATSTSLLSSVSEAHSKSSIATPDSTLDFTSSSPVAPTTSLNSLTSRVKVVSPSYDTTLTMNTPRTSKTSLMLVSQLKHSLTSDELSSSTLLVASSDTSSRIPQLASLKSRLSSSTSKLKSSQILLSSIASEVTILSRLDFSPPLTLPSSPSDLLEWSTSLKDATVPVLYSSSMENSVTRVTTIYYTTTVLTCPAGSSSTLTYVSTHSEVVTTTISCLRCTETRKQEKKTLESESYVTQTCGKTVRASSSSVSTYFHPPQKTSLSLETLNSQQKLKNSASSSFAQPSFSWSSSLVTYLSSGEVNTRSIVLAESSCTSCSEAQSSENPPSHSLTEATPKTTRGVLTTSSHEKAETLGAGFLVETETIPATTSTTSTLTPTTNGPGMSILRLSTLRSVAYQQYSSALKQTSCSLQAVSKLSLEMVESGTPTLLKTSAYSTRSEITATPISGSSTFVTHMVKPSASFAVFTYEGCGLKLARCNIFTFALAMLVFQIY